MGTYIYDTIVITCFDDNYAEAIRQHVCDVQAAAMKDLNVDTRTEQLCRVSEVISSTWNSRGTFIVSTDGAKLGSKDHYNGEEIRRRIKDEVLRNASLVDWVEVRTGECGEPYITDHEWFEWEDNKYIGRTISAEAKRDCDQLAFDKAK